MDVAPLFDTREREEAGFSSLARGVTGSEILKIAAEIRALKAECAVICDLTVGDFDPAQFPIPKELLELTRDALAEGHTNYPPSDGVLALREAIARHYARDLGLKYPVESILVAAGARPLLYGTYRTLIDPGDVALYPVPSWNNNHYVYLSGARGVAIPVSAASNFFPTVDQLRPLVGEARLLVLNSPLNPTGTVIDPHELEKITRLVVDENRRRGAASKRPLYLVYDQVYGPLTFGHAVHATPVGLVPEAAPYTLLLDAVSKSFCATGLRVGWGVMPPGIRKRMADILGHVGAWAPKAEQVAVARILDAPEITRPFQAALRAKLMARLNALHEGFSRMKRDGYAVDAIEPQGAIYLSVRFDLFGRSIGGRTITTNEEIRKLLLSEAGLAGVPFQAFGLEDETGWFRLSVGAVSMDDIAAVFPRLRALLGAPVAAR